ncbi:DNA-binding MarR family transcriptional regulator [Nonomuraea polychroma]|uniref:DNA-binding MarR family transcriptional regulator n=1 Tax=Nonomuraea polychroma TaxID=46176 RepID=A0A438M3S3_9ACTN|nr:MarR family transcriptional regulator [Nonomuraea polychroma]RVX40291.1 DNA-binding MarR family transcriptional regulator [Nonomuraea polychroma]
MNDEDSPAFERGTGFLLARLGSLAARSWTAFLTKHDLTQAQYLVLVTVKEQGPIGQRRLAELIAMDARNIVMVLDSLSPRGLIQRRTHDSDRRRRIITLTDAGAALLDTIAAAAATEQDHFLHALTCRQRDHLNRLLRTLYDSRITASASSPES